MKRQIKGPAFKYIEISNGGTFDYIETVSSIEVEARASYFKYKRVGTALNDTTRGTVETRGDNVFDFVFLH